MTEIQELMLGQLACDDPQPVEALELLQRVGMRFSTSLFEMMVESLDLEQVGYVDVILTGDSRYYCLSDLGRAHMTRLLARAGSSIPHLQSLVRDRLTHALREVSADLSAKTGTMPN